MDAPASCSCDGVTLGCEPMPRIGRPRIDALETHWGDWENENTYDDIIAWAVPDRWGAYSPALPPLLLKSLIAQESGFDPNSVSESGYAGLTQISREEARSEGLKTHPHDERFVPRKNVHAGVGILQGKLDIMLHPEKMGDDYPFADKVIAAYAKYGEPGDVWTYALGAYNGGQGTVMRAMAHAFDADLNPCQWGNLIEPKDRPEKSPLYAATLEVFGARMAMAKYREISKYPVEIMGRLAG